MVCTVETLGFDAAEQKTLAATFALSVRREVVYARWDARYPQPAHLLLVDGDNPQAVEEMLSRKTDRQYPPVVVATHLPLRYNCTHVERPIRFLRLFKALDQALEAKLDADRGNPDTGHHAWASTMTMPSQSSWEAPPCEVTELPRVQAASTPRTGSASQIAVVLDLPVKLPVVSGASAAGPTGSGNVVSMVSAVERPARIRAADASSLDNLNADWVLVVDDNLAVRRFMAQKLQQFSINVDYAASGEQAIGLTGTKRYTCVFLDVVMPGMDGYQVCKLIKASRESQATRVVMLTSRDGTFDKIRGKMAGCDAYLTKPIDEEKLMNAIVKFLPEGAALAELDRGNSSMFLDSDAKKNNSRAPSKHR